MHSTPLITTLVVGLVLAFILGALAQRVRLSPLVGYLAAGLLIGPYSPGYVADLGIAAELAELGVILLMFGVGLHFSLKDLLSVRSIAVPGALIQIATATGLGIGLSAWLGWSLATGIIFGLALSVASTVVLIRALQQLRLLDTSRGRIAVGWLIVEDLVMVLALVLLPLVLPLLEPGGSAITAADVAGIITLTLVKVAAFAVLMLVVGRRLIPWILRWVAQNSSSEMFRLAVLAIALGVALGAAAVFGVSFALGAFFAGMVLAESDQSQQAAEESLPFRDAFAVLFFVSVGMLFDPSIIVEQPVAVIITVLIVIVGKSVAAYAIVRLWGRDNGTALTISVSLAQIGEFSFILVALGAELGAMPEPARDMVLAAAIVSIAINPLLFYLLPSARAERVSAAAEALDGPTQSSKTHHTVIVGYGRVGSMIGNALKDRGEPFVVIEDRDKPARAAAQDGAELIAGNGADPKLLAAANLAHADRFVVAIPNAYQAGEAIRVARKSNPELAIYARAHSDSEVEYLNECGADETVLGESEIARGMLARMSASR